MESEKVYFKVKVLEYPDKESCIYSLEVEKKFPTLDMALKCIKIWKKQFGLNAKIERIYVHKCEEFWCV